MKDPLTAIAEAESVAVATVTYRKCAIGIITLEDVIEELIQEEIIDETDVYVDVAKRIRVSRLIQRVSNTPSDAAVQVPRSSAALGTPSSRNLRSSASLQAASALAGSHGQRSALRIHVSAADSAAASASTAQSPGTARAAPDRASRAAAGGVAVSPPKAAASGRMASAGSATDPTMAERSATDIELHPLLDRD